MAVEGPDGGLDHVAELRETHPRGQPAEPGVGLLFRVFAVLAAREQAAGFGSDVVAQLVVSP
jgi:hypothetical protein